MALLLFSSAVILYFSDLDRFATLQISPTKKAYYPVTQTDIHHLVDVSISMAPKKHNTYKPELVSKFIGTGGMKSSEVVTIPSLTMGHGHKSLRPAAHPLDEIDPLPQVDSLLQGDSNSPSGSAQPGHILTRPNSPADFAFNSSLLPSLSSEVVGPIIPDHQLENFIIPDWNGDGPIARRSEPGRDAYHSEACPSNANKRPPGGRQIPRKPPRSPGSPKPCDKSEVGLSDRDHRIGSGSREKAFADIGRHIQSLMRGETSGLERVTRNSVSDSDSWRTCYGPTDGLPSGTRNSDEVDSKMNRKTSIPYKHYRKKSPIGDQRSPSYSQAPTQTKGKQKASRVELETASEAIRSRKRGRNYSDDEISVVARQTKRPRTVASPQNEPYIGGYPYQPDHRIIPLSGAGIMPSGVPPPHPLLTAISHQHRHEILKPKFKAEVVKTSPDVGVSPQEILRELPDVVSDTETSVDTETERSTEPPADSLKKRKRSDDSEDDNIQYEPQHKRQRSSWQSSTPGASSSKLLSPGASLSGLGLPESIRRTSCSVKIPAARVSRKRKREEQENDESDDRYQELDESEHDQSENEYDGSDESSGNSKKSRPSKTALRGRAPPTTRNVRKRTVSKVVEPSQVKHLRSAKSRSSDLASGRTSLKRRKGDGTDDGDYFPGGSTTGGKAQHQRRSRSNTKRASSPKSLSTTNKGERKRRCKGNGVHPCPIPDHKTPPCQETFTRPADANRHARLFDAPPPECPHCRLILSRDDAVTRHLGVCPALS
ncbi:hypothetical protein C8R43DRAFT_1101314 [Mycena crocata]|nr:hypothetical protein C8R43DRAFT_1101314 [Mycena crocata]